MLATIVLIPGSFSRVSLYSTLIKTLQSHDYDVHGVDLKSVGDIFVTGTTMAEDAAYIASYIKPLISSGRSILLVAHSYGGVPATESVAGLSAKVRLAEGLQGGVIGIVYMAAIVPQVGTSAIDALRNNGKEGKLPYYVELNVNINRSFPLLGWLRSLRFCRNTGLRVSFEHLHMSINDPVMAARNTYSDLGAEKGLKLAKQLEGHSAMSFAGKLGYAAYLDVPVTYLICEEDIIIDPEKQKMMVKMMEKNGAKVEVVSLKSGHCPNESHPEEVIKAIRKAAGEIL